MEADPVAAGAGCTLRILKGAQPSSR